MKAKTKVVLSSFLLIVLLLFLIILSQMLLGVGISNVNAEIMSDVVVDVQNEQGLGKLLDNEIRNIDLMFNVEYNKQKFALRNLQNAEVTSERYLTIKDFDGTDKYLYAEYLNGGYAIYDRLGEYLYEQSRYGGGPYDKYLQQDALFYGGPTYYYVKQSNEYNDIMSNEAITQEEGKVISASLAGVRQSYEEGYNDKMSLSSVVTRATQVYSLGQGIANEDLCLNVGWYFTARAVNHKLSYNALNKLQVYNWDPNNENNYDCYSGWNRLGSCGYVALSTIMMFYERIGKAKMLPNDLNNLRMLYDYPITFVDSHYSPYIIDDTKLSNIPKSLLASEYLHQELLYNNFPQYAGTQYNQLKKSGVSFGSIPQDLKNAYNAYASSKGLATYSFKYTSGTIYLPERIVEGNPAIVTISNGYPLSDYDTDRHAVVAYAFEGSRFIWYSIDSVYCDYGWEGFDLNEETGETENLRCVKINASFIERYSYFDIF